jgi:hypothetical protein
MDRRQEEFRPPSQPRLSLRPGQDDLVPRTAMEASENAGSRQGSGGPALHRIDPDRVAETLSLGSNAAGFARLNLMVNTIFDRLVAADERKNRG